MAQNEDDTISCKVGKKEAPESLLFLDGPKGGGREQAPSPFSFLHDLSTLGFGGHQ